MVALILGSSKWQLFFTFKIIINCFNRTIHVYKAKHVFLSVSMIEFFVYETAREITFVWLVFPVLRTVRNATNRNLFLLQGLIKVSTCPQQANLSSPGKKIIELWEPFLHYSERSVKSIIQYLKYQTN